MVPVKVRTVKNIIFDLGGVLLTWDPVGISNAVPPVFLLRLRADTVKWRIIIRAVPVPTI